MGLSIQSLKEKKETIFKSRDRQEVLRLDNKSRIYKRNNIYIGYHYHFLKITQ